MVQATDHQTSHTGFRSIDYLINRLLAISDEALGLFPKFLVQQGAVRSRSSLIEP
jgi:hypothetical protein